MTKPIISLTVFLACLAVSYNYEFSGICKGYWQPPINALFIQCQDDLGVNTNIENYQYEFNLYTNCGTTTLQNIQAELQNASRQWSIPSGLSQSTNLQYCDYYQLGVGYQFTLFQGTLGAIILDDRMNNQQSIYYQQQPDFIPMNWNWQDLLNLIQSYCSQNSGSSSNSGTSSGSSSSGSNSSSSSSKGSLNATTSSSGNNATGGAGGMTSMGGNSNSLGASGAVNSTSNGSNLTVSIPAGMEQIVQWISQNAQREVQQQCTFCQMNGGAGANGTGNGTGVVNSVNNTGPVQNVTGFFNTSWYQVPQFCSFTSNQNTIICNNTVNGQLQAVTYSLTLLNSFIQYRSFICEQVGAVVQQCNNETNTGDCLSQSTYLAFAENDLLPIYGWLYFDIAYQQQLYTTCLIANQSLTTVGLNQAAFSQCFSNQIGNLANNTIPKSIPQPVVVPTQFEPSTYVLPANCSLSADNLSVSCNGTSSATGAMNAVSFSFAQINLFYNQQETALCNEISKFSVQCQQSNSTTTQVQSASASANASVNSSGPLASATSTASPTGLNNTCLSSALMGWFQQQNLMYIYGWLYFDANAQAEIIGDCTNDNATFNVPISTFNGACSGDFGNLLNNTAAQNMNISGAINGTNASQSMNSSTQTGGKGGKGGKSGSSSSKAAGGSNATTNATGAGAALGNLTNNITSGAGNAAGNISSGAANAAGNATKGAGNVVGNVVGNITKGAGNAAGNITQGAGNAAGNITSGAANAAGNASQGAGNIASNISSGVGNLTNNITSGVGQAINNITNATTGGNAGGKGGSSAQASGSGQGNAATSGNGSASGSGSGAGSASTGDNGASASGSGQGNASANSTNGGSANASGSGQGSGSATGGGRRR